VESDLYPAIMAECSRGGTRVFRQQSGLSWQGTVIERTQQRLILANPRAIRSGVPGMADLGGFTTITVTPDLVGETLAIYLAIEAKAARGRLTDEQADFLKLVLRCGGRAGVARSVEDACRIVRGDTP
jgi:hypothetical protein